MTLIRVKQDTPLQRALDDRVPTAAKRAARHQRQTAPVFGRMRRERMETKKLLIPGVDLAALRRKVDPARAHEPKVITGTFRVPVDIGIGPIYEAWRNREVRKFIEYHQGQGWEWRPEHRIRVEPQRYPHFDVGDQREDDAFRTFSVRAVFNQPRPKPVRIELPRELFEPVEVTVAVPPEHEESPSAPPVGEGVSSG